MIVDDEPVVCDVVGEWLREAGYEVTACENGAEALKSIEESPPDLVLLDLVMPGMSGSEVCRRIKSAETTSWLPVVMLSGFGTTEDRIRCLDAGAEEFLDKPVVCEELTARVRALLRAKHLSDRLLLSYYELDKLGIFAETFASRIVADLRAVDVAITMARQLLGPEAGGGNHPALVWGGIEVKGTVYGVLCYYEGLEWRTDLVAVDPEKLERALTPFKRGDGHYVGRTAPSVELQALLRLPQRLKLENFVGVASGRQTVLAAGYPWEVGLYEIRLLRAMIRHWCVFERIRHESRETEKAFAYTMEALALAAEFFDANTASHIHRVSAYAGTIAKTLGRDPRFVRWITKCAQMHDVGKITIPLEIIRKPGRLDDGEMSSMRQHTLNGAHILGGSPNLLMARNIALFHHESFDGSGYPNGARGEEIPIEARIVKVADVYDALRTMRPYKEALSHQDALAVLRRGDDRVQPEHFDPQILDVFHEAQETIGHIHEETGGQHAASPVSR